MTKTIEVVVSPQGTARVQTTGFEGTTCRDASRALEHALGGRISEQMTAEYEQQMAEYNRIIRN